MIDWGTIKVYGIAAHENTIIVSTQSSGVYISQDSAETPFSELSENIGWSQVYVSYVHDRFICGKTASDLKYSFDGISWTSLGINNAARVYCATYLNGAYYIGTGTSGIYRSLDGSTWEHVLGRKTTPGTGVGHIVYCNNKYIAVLNLSRDLYFTSTDGVNWTEGTLGIGITNLVSNGKILISSMGDSYYGKLYKSTNGIDWTEVYSLTSDDEFLRCIICFNNVFMFVTSNALLYKSTDGENWTGSSIIEVSTGNKVTKDCYVVSPWFNPTV